MNSPTISAPSTDHRSEAHSKTLVVGSTGPKGKSSKAFSKNGVGSGSLIAGLLLGEDARLGAVLLVEEPYESSDAAEMARTPGDTVAEIGLGYPWMSSSSSWLCTCPESRGEDDAS